MMVCRLTTVLLAFSPHAYLLAAELHLTNGQRYEARLVRADNQSLRFEVDQRQTEFAVDSTFAWGCREDRFVRQLVLLADGSQLVGRICSIDDRRVRVESKLFGDVLLLRTQIVGAIYAAPSDQLEMDRLIDRIALPSQPDRADNDLLLLSGGDSIAGSIAGYVDDRFRFRSDDGAELNVPASRVLGLMFADSKRSDLPPSRFELGLVDGSRLLAKQFRLGSDRLSVELVAQTMLSTGPLVKPVDERIIRFVQVNHPNIVHLSDLARPAYRHEPFLSIKRPLGIDRNVQSGRLRHGQCIFSKGLGMTSASRVVYRLDRPFQRFEAKLGLDRTAGTDGSVVYQILINDGSKWDRLYRSDLIRGGQPLIPISLAIPSDAKQLALLVEFGEGGDVKDLANWFDARLIAK